MNNAMRNSLAVVAVFAMAAAACGGDDDDSTPDTTEQDTTEQDTTVPETTVPETTEQDTTTVPDTTVPDETAESHGGTDCYVRRGLVVVDAGSVDVATEALFGLIPTSASAEIGESTTATSAAAIDGLISIYETPADPLATAIALRNHGVVSAAPVSMAAYAGHWTFLPGPKAPAPSAFDDIHSNRLDGGPLIAIADTGLVKDLPDDLDPGADLTQESDHEEPDEFGVRISGHGTFVASILRQVFPEARILTAKVHRVAASDFLPPGSEPLPDSSIGVSDELHVFDAMVRLSEKAAADGVDIAGLNLSLGVLACPELIDLGKLETYLRDNAAAFDDLPIEGLVDPQVVVDASRDATTTLSTAMEFWMPLGVAQPSRGPVYASAGNEGPTFVFAPASFDAVTGVASTYHDGTPSCFSAEGDVEEVGESIVGVGVLDGVPQLVSWSGTSFSSPLALARELGGDSSIQVDTTIAQQTCPP